MRSPIEELSDTDVDEDLDEDMEALRKACQLDNNNNNNNNIPFQTYHHDDLLDSDSDESSDLALMRSIQQRFSVSNDVLQSHEMPDCSDDDCQDDFETLRAIQRRFSSYNDDSKGEDELRQGGMKVGATIVGREKETFSSLFVKRNNAGEGFLDCVDTSEGGGEKSQVFDDTDGAQVSSLSKSDVNGTDAEAGSAHGNYQFPPSAHAFFGAILKNRSCQIHIRRKMGEMETRIQDLEKVIKEVKLLKGFQASCKRRTGRALSLNADARRQLISVPKQRGNVKTDENDIPAMYKGPPENPHVAIYSEALARYPVNETRVKWSKEEKENIVKGLKQQFQELLYRHSVNDLSDGADGSSELRDVDSIISSIKSHDITPENIRLFLPKVNWDQLAEAYVPTRNGAECQARYLNCEDPLINHNDWTTMEEKKLLHVVGQKGPGNWIDIAAALGTNRTPFQCLARYQRSLNREMLNGEWTKEEDDQLTAAVETFGESNWQVIASVMKEQRRTGSQCSNRWKKTLIPARERKGRWTAEEDKRLKVAVALFGPKTWKKVADCVPGRLQYQCRERWFNCLDPLFNKSKWTKEEDTKLEAAIAEHGYHRWNKVAACIPRRTDNQCRRRWMALFPHEALMVKEVRKIRKAALVSNFVDRESHRPTLGNNDFIVPRITGPEKLDPSRTKKGRSRRKIAKEHIEKDPPSVDICSEEASRSSNEGEVENMHNTFVKRKRSKSACATKLRAGLDGETTKSCVNDGSSKRKSHNKISKLRPRRKGAKPRCEMPETAYEAEMRVWDETILTTKEAAKENNQADAANCGESFLPDSTSLKDIQKKLVSVNGNKTNKKRKVQKPCSKSGSVRFVGDESSVETAVSIDFEDSGISSENVSLQGNASQYSVMGSNNFRDCSFESNERSKGSSEIEDDNITLASLLRRLRLGKAGKKSKAQSRFSATDVLITYSCRKQKVKGGSNNGNDACKRQVIEVDYGDDENLAHLYRTLKKRRLDNE